MNCGVISSCLHSTDERWLQVNTICMDHCHCIPSCTIVEWVSAHGAMLINTVKRAQGQK